LKRGFFATFAVLLFASSCGGTTHRTKPQLIAVEDGFYRTTLVRVRPATLRSNGRRLALGDFVAEGPSYDHEMGDISPDGRTLALGGATFGEIMLIDLASLRQKARFQILRRAKGTGVSVQVESWSKPERLIAVVSPWRLPWWASQPPSGFLTLVDPVHRRVVRRVPLKGGALDVVHLHDGTVATLTSGDSPPRLVEMRPGGDVRFVELPGLRTHLRGVRVQGEYFPPSTTPALATDGTRRAFVSLAGSSIAEIDLESMHVRYHDVDLPDVHIPGARPQTPGTGGVELRRDRALVWLGRGLLGVAGGDEDPVVRPSGQIGFLGRQRALQVVDTRTWRLIRTLSVLGCQPASDVLLCSKPGNFNLVAYGPRWGVRYRKATWWEVQAGRLFVGSGQNLSAELDPETGARIRRLDTSVLGGSNLLLWQPPE
jgi:hypothetical protein